MRKIVRKCSKILAGVLLTVLLAACGSKKDETTATSSMDPAVFYSHSVAISSSTRRIYSWGVNTYGQLGSGVTTARSTPAKVKIVDDDGNAIVMNGVSAGGTHTLAFGGVDDPVYAWGNNGFGQLGDNNLTIASTNPVKVRYKNGTTHPPLTGITAVAAGGNHSLALDSNGTVWAWGSNLQGQLGLGEVTPKIGQLIFAEQVTSLVNITRIAAGGSHSLAMSSDGTVWSWGLNRFGQLGQGLPDTKIRTPAMVVNAAGTGNLTDVIHIAAGGSHSLFVTSDGNVWACGLNIFGQLGDGDETLKRKDAVVKVLKDKDPDIQLTGAIAIAAGLDHSLAIINDGSGTKGTVWAWGSNDFGQLGNQKNFNTNTAVTIPVQVKKEDGTALENVTKIVAIGNHSLAVDSSGQLWAWGDNTYGQLGNSKTTNRAHVIRITGIPNPDLYMPEHL
jgi:alpha-tubulin suppressor-like RCC1 family protein